MNSRRIIPWFDFLMVGFFSIVSVVLLVAVFMGGAKIEALAITTATTTGFILVALLVFLRWFFSKPDFFTEVGTAIWTGGIPQITKNFMDRALAHYAAKLNNINPKIRKELIKDMLSKAAIEWDISPVSYISNGWFMANKAGLHRGYDIKVQWKGSVSQSAFFHELHHMVDEIILKKSADYEHKDVLWWKVENDIRGSFYE
jgi:hypothetical protein